MKVEFYSSKEVKLEMMKYAVIMSRYEGKWIFVQHRERDTWEAPGGRREVGESIFECAARELMEETGVLKFALFPVCPYSVETVIEKSFGMLFFADVHELGPLSGEFEIARQELFLDPPKDLTYHQIQPILYERILEFVKERGL